MITEESGRMGDDDKKNIISLGFVSDESVWGLKDKSQGEFWVVRWVLGYSGNEPMICVVTFFVVEEAFVAELARKGVLSCCMLILLFHILMSETTQTLRNKYRKYKEAFEGVMC